jgi:type I site-specific restriction endonuclease
MTPEETARQDIDRLLTAAGWVVQNYKEVNFSVGRGIALREVPLKTGPCEYDPAVPIEKSEFVMIDECQRPIDDLWWQVIAILMQALRLPQSTPQLAFAA